MDSTEAAELIRELREENTEEKANERFRSRTALAISVLATLLAFTTLAGDNAAEDMISANIHASDLGILPGQEYPTDLL